jgi:hypothetical protein
MGALPDWDLGSMEVTALFVNGKTIKPAAQAPPTSSSMSRVAERPNLRCRRVVSTVFPLVIDTIPLPSSRQNLTVHHYARLHARTLSRATRCRMRRVG